jgi:molecular chaperone Hsp33
MRRSAGDHLVRGLARGSTVRVVAAVTTDLVREAVQRHAATAAAAIAMGRAATAALLLATLTKDRERVTLRIADAAGAVRLTADADAAGEARVDNKDPGDGARGASGTSPRGLVAPGGRGILQVARDLGLREIVSGQTELADGDVDSDVERYLRASEQVDSVLVADVHPADAGPPVFAGGLLAQALPDAGAGELLAEWRDRLRRERLHAPAEEPPAFAADLARRALGDAAADLRILDVRPLRFHCPCSRERAAGTLALLGAELEDMAASGETTDVTCEFCRARYAFSPHDLRELRAAAPPPRAPGGIPT